MRITDLLSALLLLAVPAVLYLGVLTGVALLVQNRVGFDVKKAIGAAAISVLAFAVTLSFYMFGALAVRGQRLEWSIDSYSTFALWARVGVGLVYLASLALAAFLGYRFFQTRRGSLIVTGIVVLFMLLGFPLADFTSQCMIGTDLGLAFGNC